MDADFLRELAKSAAYGFGFGLGLINGLAWFLTLADWLF
jgi:hypothetical protein